jgi:hypothetical protein
MTAAQDWFIAKTKATPLQLAAMTRVVGTDQPFALAPFAIMRTPAGLRLAVAMEPPPALDTDAALRWQPDCDIVMIDPDTGLAVLANDSSGWIVGNVDQLNPRVTLYTNGLAFARAWAAARLEWLDLNRRANVPGLPVGEPYNQALPGLLLAGPLRTVCSWTPLLDRARVAVDDPAMVRPVAAALLRAKRVPIVEAIASHVRRAA